MGLALEMSELRRQLHQITGNYALQTHRDLIESLRCER